METSLTLKLGQEQLQQMDERYKPLINANHQKIKQMLRDSGRILFPYSLFGAEPIALSVINASWRTSVLEPYQSFLFTAVKRIEALDLESRMKIENLELQDLADEGFDLAIFTLALNAMEEERAKKELEEAVKRLTPKSRILLTLIKESGDSRLANLKDLLHPLSLRKVAAWLSHSGFGEPQPLGESELAMSVLFERS